MLEVFTLFLFNIIVYNIPLLYGTTGEIMIEKSGSLNLGVEGTMAIGAVVGYLAGLAVSYLLNAPRDDMMIMVSYAISGSILALFNLCHIKASGHACGVGGPCVLCAYFL